MLTIVDGMVLAAVAVALLWWKRPDLLDVTDGAALAGLAALWYGLRQWHSPGMAWTVIGALLVAWAAVSAWRRSG